MTENTVVSKDSKRLLSDSEAPEGKKIKEKSTIKGINLCLSDKKSQTDEGVFIPLNDQEKGLAGEEISNPLKDEEISPAGQEVIVPDDEDEFAQIQEYYFEALENLATDPSRAIDFMQVTINEADRLLRKHYETNPQLFDGEFYLVLGSSLFYLSQITNRGPEEEEAFIDEAISRLKSALDLCATERVNETQLALCKALYHKAGLMMQSASQAPESESQSILDSVSIIMNDAGVYMKAIFANIFEGKVSDSGKFFDPTQESIDVLGHAQLLADSETTWSSFKNRNDWCQDLYRMALDCKDASVQVNANLGVAACYISSSNYYFDNAPQDDSDSDSDGEDANQACLVAEMNPSVVKDQLTRACEHISAAIDSLGDSSVETKARAYQMQGEAYLNLGNLSSDEAEELKCYRIAVKAFQITKDLQPHGLLPDSFESFLEEWACNIE